ncbi:MAG: DUF4097 domain-containing protein [bacterium]|nr:DUF4097 domain-containing protein [bacterium]
MKFCFIMAMVLIFIGGALYLMGIQNGGRKSMDELLSNVGVSLPGKEYVSEMADIIDLGSESYDINDASIFRGEYEIWSGNVSRRQISQGPMDVLNLELEIGGSMVELEESDDGNIYIEGESVGKLQAYMEGSVLYVRSVRPANLMDEIKNSTITLYLPEDCFLQNVEVSLGAGQLKLEHLAVQDMTASIGAGQLLMEDMDLGILDVSLGAGELRTEDVTVETLSASIGMGNMEFAGDITGSADISCNMGNVSMELDGIKEDFNYQLNCVAGNMELDGDSFSGAAVDRFIDYGAQKNIEINCSMGNVEVDF